MNEWQPIETAPRDGRWFLCYVPIDGHRQFLGLYSKQGLLLNEYAQPAPFPPTHWVPLPAPPVQSERVEG